MPATSAPQARNSAAALAGEIEQLRETIVDVQGQLHDAQVKLASHARTCPEINRSEAEQRRRATIESHVVLCARLREGDPDASEIFDAKALGERQQVLGVMPVEHDVAVLGLLDEAARARYIEALPAERVARVLAYGGPVVPTAKITAKGPARTSDVPLDKRQAAELDRLGIEVARRDDGEFLVGTVVGASTPIVERLDRWEARCRFDLQLADLVAEGHLTLTPLSEEASREREFQRLLRVPPSERPVYR